MNQCLLQFVTLTQHLVRGAVWLWLPWSVFVGNCEAQILRGFARPDRGGMPVSPYQAQAPFSEVPPPMILPVSNPSAPVNPAQLYQGDIHLELSEKLLQILLNRQEQSSGSIQDFASGAMINGQQTTQTQMNINCRPSTEGAHFDFVITGQVLSETTASTPQAQILQQGNTQFQAVKRVLLDGENILTKKAVIQVMPNQTITGVQTRHSQMPLFGRLADRIAYNTAIARTPESNLIAGQKVIARLQPEIDSQIDQKLGQANKLMKEQLWGRLGEWNLQPHKKSAFSTEHRLHWDYQLSSQSVAWSAPEIAEPPTLSAVPLPAPATTHDVVIHLHDSLFATVAAKRGLAGKTISLNDLRDATDRLFLLLTDEIPDDSNELPLAVNFTFAQQHPLYARYYDNRLELVMRGTFQAGNLPKTETQQIRLQIESALENDAFEIRVTRVQVREESVTGEVLEPGITQRAIAAQLQSQLRPIKLKRFIHLPPHDPQGVILNITEVSSQNGWMTMAFDAQAEAGNSPTPAGNPLPFSAPNLQPPVIQSPTFQPPQTTFPSEPIPTFQQKIPVENQESPSGPLLIP